MNRIKWVDMARGIGILAVMLGHLVEWTPVGSVIYSFHMPLFFLLSGYLFSIGKSFPEFLKKKAKTMLLPYFCLAVPMILFDMASGGANSWPYAPLITEKKIISLDGNNGTFNWNNVRGQKPGLVFSRDALGLLIQKRMWTFWFMAVLFLASLLFYVVVRFIKKEALRAVVIGGIGAFGFVYAKQGFPVLPWNLDTVPVVMTFLYLGFLAQRYELTRLVPEKKLPRLLLFFAAAALNIGLCFLNWRIAGEGLEMYYSQYGNILVMYASALTGTAAVCLLGSLFTFPPVRYIGENSVVYFLLHQGIFIPAASGILMLLGILQGNGPLEYWIRQLVIVVLMCLLLTGVNLLITKTPLRVILGKPRKA